VLGDVGIEKVTSPGDCLDQAVLVVGKCVAQLTDALHERIVRYNDVVPDGLLKLLLLDKTAGALSQMAQYLEGFGPQFEFAAIQTQATASQVQHKAIELKYSRDGLVHFSAPGRPTRKNRRKIVDRPSPRQDF